LAAEFVSYIAPFTAEFRLELWKNQWIPYIKAKNIPITEGADPLGILTTSSGIAQWKNEGLPEDKMSLENGAIITSCTRWPLMIDPQLQGSIWIKGHVAAKAGDDDEYEDIIRFSLTTEKWMQTLQQAISFGKTVLIESVTADIDPLLEPLLSRAIIRKGRSATIELGGEPCDYSDDFALYLQCKLFNPHFRPETAAQCTIINFIVTETGLEDQLLALVVNIEKPELEEKKQVLVKQRNDFEITLRDLEKNLLSSLSAADSSTILDNHELIQNLDNTKETAKTIEIQAKEAEITEVEINIERNKYRTVAAEGSMLYFLIIGLEAVNHMYQYSLESFN
jgi:dynein heavy chain